MIRPHTPAGRSPIDTERDTAPAIGRRTLLGGTLAAGLGLTAAACSPGSAGRPGQQTAPKEGDGGAQGYDGPAVELAFWHGLTGGDGPIMKQLTDRFTEEFPKITIKQQAIAWDQYYEKLPAAVSQGKGPDIAIMHIDRVATNAARQVIQPLDDVNKALGLGEGDYVPIAWRGGQYDNKHWSVPLDVHCAGLYYNTKTMEKVGLDPEQPPTTADEYLNALDKAKSKGIQGMWVSALSASGLLAQTLVYQFGGRMVADDGSAVEFASDAGVQAVDWLKMLIKEGYSPAKAAADGDVVSFQNDKSLFMFNGSWMVTPLNDVKKLEWDATVVPNIGGTQAVWSGSHQMVLPANKGGDENKSEAGRVFLNWLSKHSLDWADAGQVPARNDVRENAKFADKGPVVDFAKQLDYIHFTPPVPGITDCLVDWAPAVNAAMLGKKETKAALEAAQAKGNKILEQNKKKYG
ncbi:ABC transporter substrate-binding protein [Microlunatus soli]|uniref:Multiple sugar transport system substrate-binding protein n=1 Tax=Microlunatus soli TaxID=630515 RepID=A0A1H1MBS4_9ACTN|nr:ABC transporter substrate-binding protein [Microlunatus soli]SDR84052.1 multiple sugar transport system substrate-binding protein [Microlunatus soli]